jgi:hypothetical protein
MNGWFLKIEGNEEISVACKVVSNLFVDKSLALKKWKQAKSLHGRPMNNVADKIAGKAVRLEFLVSLPYFPSYRLTFYLLQTNVWLKKKKC